MPDHLHFVASLEPRENLSRLMHSLKSYSAKEINRELGKEGKVWQEGFYSHGIRDERDAVRRIGYLLSNPVRAGLADAASDYKLSSANEAFEVDPL
jgi:putative DNA methylase